DISSRKINLLIGILEGRRGKAEKAIAYLQEATGDSTLEVEANTELSARFIELGELEKACSAIEEAIRLGKAEQRITHLQKRAEVAEAEEDSWLAQRLERNNRNAATLQGARLAMCGDINLAQGRIEVAAVAYRAAQEFEPTNAGYRRQLASAM